MPRPIPCLSPAWFACACMAAASGSVGAADVRGAPVAVGVDVSSGVRPLSPLIFGVAFGDAKRNAEVGYTMQRWGGNSVTRYNWRVDVHSTAGDWYYENIPGATDRSQVPANRKVRTEVLGERKVALTVMVATTLDPKWLLEIEAIAMA